MHKMRAAVLILFLASSLAFGGCLMRQRTGKDGKGPEISMDNSEISVSIHADEAELLSGVTAYDAKDGDVTDSLAVEHISNFIEKGGGKSASLPLIRTTMSPTRNGKWSITTIHRRSFLWMGRSGSV